MAEPVRIGDAELWLGDCLEILPTLSGVDAVVTDPPYGIGDAAFQMGQRSGKRSGGDNDWHAESWWDAELDPAWCSAVCEAAPIVAWFGHWRKRGEVEAAMKWPLRSEIVWAKDCHVGPPCPVAMRDERIWLFARDGIKGATFETSVWDEPIIPTWRHKEHKNEKPIGLMARLIAFLGVETIADPFMGSGTTGVACVRHGCRFIGIEREPAHFVTAVRRIEDAYRQGDMFRPAPQPKPEQLSILGAER